MIAASELVRRIQGALPDAKITVTDLTGQEDHYRVEIVSGAFEGLLPIARHRLVHAPLRDVIGGPLHAVELVTKTPKE